MNSVFWLDQIEMLTREKEVLLLVLEESKSFVKSGNVNLIQLLIKAVSTIYSSMIYDLPFMIYDSSLIIHYGYHNYT